MPRQTVGGHIRENGSLLAVAEKRALIWMAERLPRWVGSDHLTLLGLGAMLAAGLAYWVSGSYPLALWLVVVALAVNWFGDSLDGTVARVRNQQRPMYGYYVDHVIDIVGALFLLGGLAMSGYMTPLVALGLLIGYLMLSAETYLATHASASSGCRCSRSARPSSESCSQSARCTCSTSRGSSWRAGCTACSTSVAWSPSSGWPWP